MKWFLHEMFSTPKAKKEEEKQGNKLVLTAQLKTLDCEASSDPLSTAGTFWVAGWWNSSSNMKHLLSRSIRCSIARYEGKSGNPWWRFPSNFYSEYPSNNTLALQYFSIVAGYSRMLQSNIEIFHSYSNPHLPSAIRRGKNYYRLLNIEILSLVSEWPYFEDYFAWRWWARGVYLSGVKTFIPLSLLYPTSSSQCSLYHLYVRRDLISLLTPNWSYC